MERIHSLLYGVRVIPSGKKTNITVSLREIDPGVIFEDGSFRLSAFPVTHRGPDCYGYLFEELPRRPFLPEKADALGVPHGPIRRDLVEGKAVTLPDGKQVTPEEVMGEELPGTKYVHVGDTGRTDDILEVCRGADALVIEATYLKEEEDMARDFAHLTAEQAALLAKEAGVGQLILTHISRRYRESDVIKEARAVFPNTVVARDFDCYQVKRGETVKVEE